MQYDLAKHDFSDPDPWVALELDRSTYFDPGAKAALLRGNASRSRQFLLPLIRPMARLSIVLVQLIRIAIPNNLTSTRYLHALIVWGMKNFLSPEANYLIFRHFHIGSQMLKFLADNVDGVQVRSHPLKPRSIDDFRNNTYVQHDLNIFNFIIQINAQGGEFRPVPHDRIDFSAIEDVDGQLPGMPDGRGNFLDLQSAIEIYTPLFALFLSDRDFWRSSNSLQLDETIAIYVARLFDREAIVGLVNNKHPCVPISTLAAGFRLMLHGLDAENLYGFVRHMRDQQQKRGEPAAMGAGASG
ncbi:MAG TPA: hypothetical protein VGI20_10430 [Rhizomicrobium sp.]|jgi:hypothetical protein